MRLRGPQRVKNPDKVQPDFNASEQATLTLCNALEALMNATAIRAEDKAPILDMLRMGRDQTLESYRERMTVPPPVVSDWPEGISDPEALEKPGYDSISAG